MVKQLTVKVVRCDFSKATHRLGLSILNHKPTSAGRNVEYLASVAGLNVPQKNPRQPLLVDSTLAVDRYLQHGSAPEFRLSDGATRTDAFLWLFPLDGLGPRDSKYCKWPQHCTPGVSR